MSLFDQLQQEAGGLDLSAIGAQVGLSPDQVQEAGSKLLPKVADPDTDNDEATRQVADETGIPHSKLQDLLGVIMQHAQAGGASGGAMGTLMQSLGGGDGGEAGGEGGSLLGNVMGAFER